MARLVFPGSPSNGDKHEHAGKIFRYLATKNRWDAVGTTAVSATKAEELETRLATIETDGSGTGTEAIANASLLSLSDLEAGAMSFDQENNRLYITNGTGWYSIALVNEAPSITFASNAEFTMGAAGANTVDLTYTVVEPEGTPTVVTISNTGLANTSVANVQHFTSNNTIRVNNFYANTEVDVRGIIRATVSDGINLGITSAPFVISNSVSLYDFTNFYIEHGIYGRDAPSLSVLRANMGGTHDAALRTNPEFFDEGYFTGYGLWTVPETADYQIRIWGASAFQSNDGGTGARATATFRLSKEDQIQFLIGQAPTAVASKNSSNHGGAGGTFVSRGNKGPTMTLSDLMMVAGGGAGGHNIRSATTDAHRLQARGQESTTPGYGTTNIYNGGNSQTGASWNAAGIGQATPQATAYNAGGLGGGTSGATRIDQGGFGGGGRHGGTHGGGGGGYAGGAGSSNDPWKGGGGSSYIAPEATNTEIENSLVAYQHNGRIEITKV